ncbi:MAG: hypothetical protein IJ946_06145 [Clostridia bacterium]|nr:hypothetical protein [Clostridia bacterium]
MKKEYVRPELNVLSLVVEDNTNNIGLEDMGKDDNRLSIGALGNIFE